MDAFYPGIGRLGFGFYHGARKETLSAFLPTGAGYGPDSGAAPISMNEPRDVPLTTNDTFVLVPYPLVLLLSAVLPFCWLARRRPYRNGDCRGCGYSLTGNTRGICPECGSAVAQPTKALASADEMPRGRRC
ncbi:MAG TPA: hypothetical protein VK797_25355 [Tepidisphaeraceae bacterium]|jgi:hypothetical protein|nr:hypothetical protein [Tepidisphaeraceae bacterium]